MLQPVGELSVQGLVLGGSSQVSQVVGSNAMKRPFGRGTTPVRRLTNRVC